MSNIKLPSRVKALSLAISQSIVLGGGLVSTQAASAQACGNVVAPGATATVSVNTTGSICQTDPGSVTVTLESGVTLIGDQEYGVAIRGGLIELGTDAAIVVATDDNATGLGADSATEDVTVTLGSGARVEATVENNNDYSYATAMYFDSNGKDVTVTLGASSEVSAAASGYYGAYSEAIVVDTTSSNGYGADVSISGTSTSISSNATSSDYYAEAVGIYVDSETNTVYSTSSTTVDLTSSSVSVAAQGYEDANSVAMQILTDSDAEGPVTTTVTLSSTSVSSAATSQESDAYAEGVEVVAQAESVQFEGKTVAELDVTGGSISATASSAGEDAGAYAISVDARDEYSGGKGGLGEGQADAIVTLSDVEVTASATSVDDVDTTAIEVSSYAEAAASTSVTLDGGSTSAIGRVVTSEDESSEATSDVEGIRANARSVWGTTETEVSLTNAQLTVDADVTANGTGAASAYAEGISASSSGKYNGSESAVTLNGSTVTVNAKASVPSADYYSEASVVGISASAYAEGDVSTSVVLNNGASLEVTAEAQYAEAIGISASSDAKYGDDTASVSLNSASVSVSAIGSDFSYAEGIYVEGDNVDVNLTDSTLEVSAQITDEGYGSAVGIQAEAGQQLAVSLSDTSVNVRGNSDNYTPYTISAGIRIDRAGDYGSGYGATITLNNSSIVVENDGEAPTFGIVDMSSLGKGSSGPITITLDANSSVRADLAIATYAEGSSLNNAGAIEGDVFIETINNNGFITGNVFSNSITTSGTITGAVGGTTLNVESGGVVAGTADVQTLTVAAGGELQAILTDETDTQQAHFTAVDATLENGASVRINGTSDLFNPEEEGVSYLIVEADNSLDADIDQLLLRTSGLIAADWEDCGDLSLCVSVRAMDLIELAQADQASANGVGGASAAQSVLVELSGSDEGDQFFDLIDRVVEQGAWEELDGSGIGENLLATRDSDRVVSRYIQRLMQQGRSSGEEFSGARGLWVQALLTDGDGDSQNGVAGFEVDTTGLAIGYDTELRPGWVIGGVVSMADSQVESDDNLSKVETDTLMASIYGQWTQGPLFANAVLTYGRGDNDGRRDVAGDLVSSDYDSDFISTRFQVGKVFGFESGIQLSPRAEFTYSRVDIDSYDESGSVAALSVGSQRYETLELGAGVEISKSYLVEKAVWTPYLDLAIYHDFADDQVQTTNRFVIGGDNFVSTGSEVEQTNVSATMGVSYAVGAHHAFKAAYEYLGNSDYDSASWMLRYSYAF